MKEITIKVSDKVLAILEGMCETDRETPESIAAALVFENLYEREIDEAWETIDSLTASFVGDDFINARVSRFCDILTYCAYSVDLPQEQSMTLLREMISLLNAYKTDEAKKNDIDNLVANLDEKLKGQVPSADELANAQDEGAEHNHDCGCGCC